MAIRIVTDATPKEDVIQNHVGQTRREIILGAAVAAIHPRASGAEDRLMTPVHFDVPRHACDCHTHIFGDPKTFPLSPAHSYTPKAALPREMLALHRALHIERVVIVTPSVYGTDNSATLFGIKTRGKAARGIAVIEERITDRDLDTLARAGFRGVRINVATSGPTDPAAARQRLQAAIQRLEGRNWHIQVYINARAIPAIKDAVLASPIPVVFDHFGGAQAALGIAQPGFPELIELVQSGKAYVKVSGAYRASTQSPNYSDAAPLAKALIAANPERVLWGTDWPHPDSTARPGRAPGAIAAFLPIDDGNLLNQLSTWAPDPAIREKILVRNPARLYEF